MARYSFAFVVLAFLIISGRASAGDAAQPVPADGKCSVPADPQWTSQEKFVWQHVCVGDIANFDAGSNYGGNLDPKRPEGLPDSRILRSSFLETILLADKYRHALTRYGVRIVGARFKGIVDLEDAQLGNNLVLDRSLLEGAAVLARLSSTHTIFLDGSVVAGTLNMEALQLGGGLFIRYAKISAVDLRDSHVSGQLSLRGSEVTGLLNMDRIQVDQSLIMHDAQLGGFVTRNASIGGQVDLAGSKVTGTFDMDSLHVDHDLLMHDRAVFGPVLLLDVHIGGQIDLSGSRVTGTFDMDTLQVGSNAIMGRGAEFDGPINFIFGKVGGSLELAGGLFKSAVDLTDTQIGGELRLGSSRQAPARWTADSTLILRNVRADAIQDLSNSWPDKLDLNRFTYRSLGGINSDEKDPMLGRPIGWFEAWLGKQAVYTPGPYQQLATVLREQGQPDTADEILYAGKERERAQSTSMVYTEATANKWFIGYGYHKFWSMYWALGFLISGTLLLWLSGQGGRVSRHYSLPYGIFYSFDFLLPIIRLREKHYQIDLRGWIRYYFYVHRIMGYVLASFLIAGISGLVK